MKIITQFPVFNPYGKATCEVYVSGCRANCLNCHNPELQSFEVGEELNTGKLVDYLEERQELFSIISITGGDLFYQDELEAMKLCSTLKLCFPEKEFWLFTGAEMRNLPIWYFKIFNVVKTGVYDESKKQAGFPASSNQKLYKKGLDY